MDNLLGPSLHHDAKNEMQRSSKKKYNITVKHVKVSDTANVVAKILSEKNVKKNNNGTVDLVWINGENFSFMKTNNLLLNEKWIFKS